MTGRIYSIGYEGLDLDRLVEHLVSPQVKLVIDVRLNPISRKPGLSKGFLSTRLEEAGIGYRHDAALGNPPDNRRSFRIGDGETGRRRMRELLSNGSQPALQRLVEDARARQVAVLCVEREPQRCHRQVVTDMAQELDPSIDVLDIL